MDEASTSNDGRPVFFGEADHPAKHGPIEAVVAELDACHYHFAEVAHNEMRPAKIRARQVALFEENVFHTRVAQVRASEIDPDEIGSAKRSVGEFAPFPGSAN